MFPAESLIARLRERARGEALWQINYHGPGTRLFAQGEPCAEVLVQLGGLVKLTYLTVAGDEWIKSFVVDRGLFGALEGGTSRFGAMTVEPTEVVRLPAEWVRSALQADEVLAREATSFDRWLIARKQAREEALLCETVEERYRQMLSEEANLLSRLPQGDIARYLRVTPIAFSRIKRRVRTAALQADVGTEKGAT